MKHLYDRSDGTLLKDIDSMHFIMPLMYPNRCDNEAFISEMIDLTALDAWLEEKMLLIRSISTTCFRLCSQPPSKL